MIVEVCGWFSLLLMSITFLNAIISEESRNKAVYQILVLIPVLYFIVNKLFY